eukprot:TRINITY_DN1745_c0_g1_i1.p1 TRINITY_DN1745_c0_g1~~TRINITY_DN1745_c0_g1_i1.p1  ORF type:complete len:1253 (-),score=415.70 TRINITY_DN1745_c0_g1_i1:5647-9405(-)
MAENVKVAIRMRPFNSGEKAANSTCDITMSGKSLTITNPANPSEKTDFAFDYCYDSFDPSSPTYASQSIVFNDLGTLFLENCWGGYNSTLLAYGQTGSGKSYSMLGYGAEQGIIPLGCQELFRRIEATTDTALKYIVEVSYLEIYNEQINDLFNPKASRAAGGNKIREDPKLGVYVEGLSRVAVSTYAQVQKWMDEGAAARTVAATKMNATSSRSHAVFVIRMTQNKSMGEGKPVSTRVSSVNLVDLAGSERQEKTGAEGDRLREACAINKSLSALGNVISALADTAKGKKVFVPYRDSVLTRLLQESLGGNSKTIMIAAVGPAHTNYDESLSTLRYADRAKRIVNKAVINESPQDKLVRDLKAEIERLKAQVGGGSGATGSSEGSDELKAQLAANQHALQEVTEDFQTKLARAQETETQLHSALSDMGLSAKELQTMAGGAPQLVNLSSDALMAGNLVYYLRVGDTVVGTGEQDGAACIRVVGSSVAPQHATLSNSDGVVTIAPIGAAKTFVNGALLTAPRVLATGDRVIVGRGFIFRFVDPKQEAANAAAGTVTTRPSPEEEWELAMKEMAAARGDTGSGAASKLLALAESVDEANDIASALHAAVAFAVDITDAQKAGKLKRVLAVKVVDIPAQTIVTWARAAFERRLLQMRQLYAEFVETAKNPLATLAQETNPFYCAPPDELLCTASLPLAQFAAEGPVVFEGALPLLNAQQVQDGTLLIKFSADPATEGPDAYRNFKIAITQAQKITNPHIYGAWVKFDFPDDGEVEVTERASNIVDGSPVWQYEANWNLPQSAELVEYLTSNTLQLEVYGYAPKPTGAAAAVASTQLTELQAQFTASEEECNKLRTRLRQALPKLKQAVEYKDRITALEAELAAAKIAAAAPAAAGATPTPASDAVDTAAADGVPQAQGAEQKSSTAAPAAEVAALQATITTLTTENETLKKELAGMQSAVESEKKALAALQAESASQKQTHDSERAALQSRATELQSRVVDLQQGLDIVRAQHSKDEARITDLNTQLAAAKEQLAATGGATQAKEAELQGQLQAAKAETEAVRKSASQTSEMLEAKQTEVASLKAILESAQQQHQTIMEQHTQIKSSTAEVSQQLTEALQKTASAEAESAALRKALKEMDESATQKQRKIEELEAEQAKQSHQIHELKEKEEHKSKLAHELKEKADKLEEQIKHVTQHAADETITRLSKLEEQMAAMAKKKQKKKAKLDEQAHKYSMDQQQQQSKENSKVCSVM